MMKAGPGSFVTESGVRPAEKKGRWILEHDVVWQQDDGLRLFVPSGFDFDGASIPRPFWVSIGAPMSTQFLRPSALHDFECRTRTAPSPDVHRRFYYALRSEGVGKVKATRMWLAVRWFGPRWKVSTPTESIDAAEA